MRLLPGTGPYLLMILLALFLMYTLWVYRKGYKAGERRTQKLLKEMFAAKVDDEGIKAVDMSFEEFLEEGDDL